MSAAALKVALSFSGSLFTEIRPHLGKKRSGAGKGHGKCTVILRWAWGEACLSEKGATPTCSVRSAAQIEGVAAAS